MTSLLFALPLALLTGPVWGMGGPVILLPEGTQEDPVMCSMPAIKHGGYHSNKSTVHIGDSTTLICEPGYHLSNRTHPEMPVLTGEVTCTAKLFGGDVGAVPECSEDSMECDGPCDEDKVFIVKGYLKDIHAKKLGMRWYVTFEIKAEDYIRRLSKRGNLRLGPNVVRWNGPGISTRQLAGKYYLAALRNIERFSGGLVGCAVGRSRDNGIACIYYKR